MDMLKSVHIEGFKSIRDATIDLGPLTVLIGANGSGKSNFISFLKMLKAITEGRLEDFVAKAGGADALLHFGEETTEAVRCTLQFSLDADVWDLTVALGYAAGDLGLQSLVLRPPDDGAWQIVREHSPSGGQSTESWAFKMPEAVGGAQRLRPPMRGWQHFHFDNTSDRAGIRQSHYIEDNKHLHHDASNIAAYLYMLRETQRPYYDRIVGAFRLAAPWFGDFVLEPRELDPTRILLNWREKGRDTLFGPHQLSDGSLRTIALLTLLLQPEDRLPSLIVIDEPELGLHPYVITLVAELLDAASTVTQVIIATQSITLLNHFDPSTVVVVDRDHEGGTTFERLSPERLSVWLDEEFSLGELWEMNVIGGGP